MGQLMCTVPADHRSFRGIIPLHVSAGNAPALLLIVSTKQILRKKKKGKIEKQPAKQYFPD